MKKVSYVMIVCLVLIVLFQKETVHATFSDVPETSWYYTHVQSLTEQGFIKGYENGRFGPNDSIIRQNVARILGRWLIEEKYYIPEDAQAVKRFYDVPLEKDDELLKVTALLYEEGIFSGTNGRLNGANKMTREQMALVLTRTLQTVFKVDLIVQSQQANYVSPISDISRLSEESQAAIHALSYAGLTNNEKFYPKNDVTRAEFVAFLNRTLDYLATQPIPDQPEENLSQPIVGNSIMIEKGTILYTSVNLLREAGVLHQDVTVALQESSNVAYIEVGKERLYVPLNKVKNVQNNEPSDRALTEIGFVRVKAGYTLYRDADYTDRLLNGTLETRFKVTEISNNGARINWAGGSAYVKRADIIQYPNLPYQLLRNTPIFKANSQVVYGSLQANAIVMPSAITEKEMTVSNSGTRYKLPLDLVMEQDELIAQPVSTKYAIDVQTKTAIDVRSVTGTVIGTVEAGQTVRISNTTNQMASIQFFGQEGTFPLEAIYHTNLVDGAKHVTYEQVVKTLKDIHALYPAFTKLEIIGQTVEGRLIYALKVGNGQREILMDASMHAREHMTTNVLMEMIDQYTTAYARNTTFAGYNVKQTLDKTSIWFVPMINADGVTLVQKGVQAVASKNTVIQINGSSNVARWKANIRGVDLNRNFDNKWAEFKTFTSPAWSGFKGNSVFSEPESKALRDFVAKHDFKAYISYHSSGNLLYYWNWQNSLHEARDFAFAKKIGSKTGYSVMKPLYRTSSGSSADWFIRVYKKPGITMEISPYAGDQPVPLKNWADVWKRNQSIGLLSAKESENF